MRLGDTLKKAAGLMFEFEEELAPPSSSLHNVEAVVGARQAKSAEQIVREQPGPNLEDIQVPQTPKEPVLDASGNVNFDAVYRMAALPESAFTAEHVLEILQSLPAELPLDARRATLKVTLSAMAKTNGVTPEAVVADASRKLAALSAFARTYSEHAKQYVSKAEQQIAAAEAEIQRLRAGISEARSKERQAIDSCQRESDRLDDVLEFFSLDVPPSKYAENKS
jgi:hypothetical protein